MTELTYKVIKNRTQYKEYCNTLETLIFSVSKERNIKDEIDLLTVLIEKWDGDHNSFEEADPVQLLRSLMADHKMKLKDLVELLGISKSYVSDMLNYKRSISKTVIRKLTGHFRVSQESFNRPYSREIPENAHPYNKVHEKR